MNIRLGFFLAVLLMMMARDWLMDGQKFCVSRHCNCRYIVLWILVELGCPSSWEIYAMPTLNTSTVGHRQLTFQINSTLNHSPPTKVKQKSGLHFRSQKQVGRC